METLVINPVKKRRTYRRRRTAPAKRRYRRRNPTVSTKGILSGVIYSFLGLTAAVLISKTVNIQRKWIIGLIGAGATMILGKRILKKNAVPVAIGFGLSSAMNLASQTKWLKGTFSDYVGCPFSMGDYPVYAPGQGYGYAGIDAGSEGDMLIENGQYMDYWLNPSRGGVTIRDMMFQDYS